MNREELKSIFDALRNDPQHHLGLGDIRLTIAQQDAILDLFPFKDNPLPPAEGAEEILTSLIKSLGEPTKIHNHIYEIRPYTVEHKTEWWIFHKEVGSGEPLTQWLSKFATLHAQRLAEKMVKKNWININDRMPESGFCVLLYSKSAGVAEGAWSDSNGYFEQWRWSAVLSDVTHWMPLPNPPVE